MCEIGELDPCTVWRETERKAKKAHKCAACHGSILPGHRYTENFNVFEGEFSHERICLACVIARQRFLDEHTDGQLCDGSAFRELLTNCIHDGDWESDQNWRPMLEAMKARQVAAQ